MPDDNLVISVTYLWLHNQAFSIPGIVKVLFFILYHTGVLGSSVRNWYT